MSGINLIDSTNSPPTIVVVKDDDDDDGEINQEEKPVQNESIHSTERTSQTENNEMKSSSVNNIEIPTMDNTTTRPSQQSLQLLDELKYLLRPTNSLASPLDNVQASQEADSSIQRRTLSLDDDAANEVQRSLIEGLSAHEAKSLNAAERRSIASRGRPSSIILPSDDRLRAKSMQPMSRHSVYSTSYSPTGVSPNPTVTDYLEGFFWAFLTAYAFSLILFLTKLFGIDLIFGYFTQMFVQTIAFLIYAVYKSYPFFGSPIHRSLMFTWALVISLGTLASFIGYYYITLPELSALRQTQVIIVIILSIFFVHERITLIRIISFILTIIAIVILIRPTTYGAGVIPVINITDVHSTWLPYSSSWNHLIGLIFGFVTALMFAISSMINRRISLSDEPLPNTIRCFWSALFGLIISLVLIYLTHFVMNNRRVFPHDWRLFVAIALALASIFVFIVHQKAMKRLPPSIVTIVYSSDIILTLILQNIFTNIPTDLVIIFGCILIFVAVWIIAVETFLDEQRKKAVAMKVAKVLHTTTTSSSDHAIKSVPKRLSL